MSSRGKAADQAATLYDVATYLWYLTVALGLVGLGWVATAYKGSWEPYHLRRQA